MTLSHFRYRNGNYYRRFLLLDDYCSNRKLRIAGIVLVFFSLLS
jgi:hypothetical protein